MSTVFNGAAPGAGKENGAGIPPENLTRIFSHGFGLHSGALAAQGDGKAKGATFILELPAQPPRSAHPWLYEPNPDC